MSSPDWQHFSARPDPLFARKVKAHIAETGQPETLAALFQGPISPGEPFEIIDEVEINQLRRPMGDLAPCPMCTPNRFLRGRICWFPRKGYVAVIGHCCANKENLAHAENEYRQRLLKDSDENYLLAALPTIPSMRKAIRELEPTASEVRALFRQFKNEAEPARKLLRSVLKTTVGRLVC